jgi:hypothetical protein
MNIRQGNYSPWGHSNWAYTEKQSIDDFSALNWKTLALQRTQYISPVKTAHLLRLLTLSAEDASWSDRVNMHRHALQ